MQAMLEAISLSQPQPKVPSELVQFVGKTYSAYHTAVPLLESHVSLFPHDARCFDALVGCPIPWPQAQPADRPPHLRHAESNRKFCISVPECCKVRRYG